MFLMPRYFSSQSPWLESLSCNLWIHLHLASITYIVHLHDLGAFNMNVWTKIWFGFHSVWLKFELTSSTWLVLRVLKFFFCIGEAWSSHQCICQCHRDWELPVDWKPVELSFNAEMFSIGCGLHLSSSEFQWSTFNTIEYCAPVCLKQCRWGANYRANRKHPSWMETAARQGPANLKYSRVEIRVRPYKTAIYPSARGSVVLCTLNSEINREAVARQGPANLHLPWYVHIVQTLEKL